MESCAFYIRVSTEDQREYSPDAQLKALYDYANRHDLSILPQHIFVDEGISGRKADKRPAFMRMIALAKSKPRPYGQILVHRFDRFARNREDSVVYKSLLRKECHIKVVSITEPLEDDKFSIILESMLEAMAEYYSLNLSDEVKKGLFEKASRGEHIGKAPYGYVLESEKLKPHPFNRKVVSQLFDLYVNQYYSLGGLIQYLTEHRIPSPSGKAWSRSSLHYILSNPVYTGMTRYNYRQKGTYLNPSGQWILEEGQHEPLISKEIYDGASQRLHSSKNRTRHQDRTYHEMSWLQHLLHCPLCHTKMTLTTSGSQHQYGSFRCPKANGKKADCSYTACLSIKKAERIFLGAIKNNSPVEKALTLVPRPVHLTEELNLLNQRLTTLFIQGQLLKKAYLLGTDTLEEYSKEKGALQKEEALIQDKIEKLLLEKEDPHKEMYLQLYCGENFLFQLLQSTELSLDQKHRALSSIFSHITINKLTNTLQLYFH